MQKLLVLNVAALSAHDISDETPHLKALVQQGSMRTLRTVSPALTCVSHATMLTGASPREHGIVANGWYEAHHGKIFNWGRSDALVQGEKIWQSAQKQSSDFRCANLFWRFCTHASCDLTLTERPTYFANGRKGADVYSSDPQFKQQCIERHGPFPFFNFWGPMAGLKASEWIMNIAQDLMREQSHHLILCYAPALDYQAQRFGPESPQAKQMLIDTDRVIGEVWSCAQQSDYQMLIVSDYAFTTVRTPVFLNRVLRKVGYLAVDQAANGEWLEPNASTAFAVCDNQVAHVYIRDQQQTDAIKQLLLNTAGVSKVLDARSTEDITSELGQALGHARSGDLLVISDPDTWFIYPYWLTDDQAPDFAHCVDIFNKPGFDPCEMLLREGWKGRLHMIKRFIQMKLSIRAPFDVISNQYDRIKGSRALASSTYDEQDQLIYQPPQAVCISSWPQDDSEELLMTEMKDHMLHAIFGSLQS